MSVAEKRHRRSLVNVKAFLWFSLACVLGGILCPFVSGWNGARVDSLECERGSVVMDNGVVVQLEGVSITDCDGAWQYLASEGWTNPGPAPAVSVAAGGCRLRGEEWACTGKPNDGTQWAFDELPDVELDAEGRAYTRGIVFRSAPGWLDVLNVALVREGLAVPKAECSEEMEHSLDAWLCSYHP